MLTIALDAMGGDHAPKAEVEGAVRAASSLGVKVLLVGQQDVVRRELEQHEGYRELPIEIVHASERVTMEDSAAKAVRSKRDSSMRVASRLVRDGCAQGFVSAGNTGAIMATAKMVQGVVPGVERPTMLGTPVVLVDVGANVDFYPEMLAQFAIMGEIYSRNILHRPNPRVEILSIGEEEHKGNDLTRAAWPLLKSLHINFIGNVEGRDVYAGNVALKVSEGLVDMFKKLLRESLEATISGKIGYALSKTALTSFRKRLDHSEYGGAPLLGVRGGCIIGHGSSNANAIKNAIRVAAEFSGGNVNRQIEEELRRLGKARD